MTITVSRLNTDHAGPFVEGQAQKAFAQLTFAATELYPTGGIDLTGVFDAPFGIGAVGQMEMITVFAHTTTIVAPETGLLGRWDADNQKLLLFTFSDNVTATELTNGRTLDGTVIDLKIAGPHASS